MHRVVHVVGVRVSTLNNRKVLPFPVITASLLKDRSDCHQGCENSTALEMGPGDAGSSVYSGSAGGCLSCRVTLKCESNGRDPDKGRVRFLIASCGQAKCPLSHMNHQISHEDSG